MQPNSNAAVNREGAGRVAGTEKTREFSGKVFSEVDMALIKETASAYPKLSRSELAGTICELVGWVQANGKPKTAQCLQLLVKLEGEGELALPALNKKTIETPKGWKKCAEVLDLSWIDMTGLEDCGPIKLDIVRPGDGLRQWRTYISAYHRLGDPQVNGSRMRYTIRTECGRDLGCMLFSASAWSLKPRDEWIGWGPACRKARLHLIVNQSRFLILPWVRSPNLASRALGMAARRIQRDWLEEFCYAPALLETFVDTSQHKGVIYRAANWAYLGETQGRGRDDRKRENELSRKAIYVYPLQRDFRAVLKGEAQCKTTEPHI